MGTEEDKAEQPAEGEEQAESEVGAQQAAAGRGSGWKAVDGEHEPAEGEKQGIEPLSMPLSTQTPFWESGTSEKKGASAMVFSRLYKRTSVMTKKESLESRA